LIGRVLFIDTTCKLVYIKSNESYEYPSYESMYQISGQSLIITNSFLFNYSSLLSCNNTFN